MGQATEYVKLRHKKTGLELEVNAAMMDGFYALGEYERIPTAGIIFKPEWHEDFNDMTNYSGSPRPATQAPADNYDFISDKKKIKELMYV